MNASTTPTSSSTRWTKCYQRGLHLMQVERNYEYAHVMFAECVSHCPNNLQFVETFLKNLREPSSSGKGMIAKLLSRGGSRELRKALARRDWKQVLRLGYGLLKSNPSDVVTLRAMAEACSHLHYNEVELAYLKQALDIAPKNAEVNKHCAISLGRMGQFEQAIACWHRVEAIKGGDQEATKMIAQLCEERLKYHGGKPTAHKPTPGPVKSDSAEVEASEDLAVPPLSPVQQLEQEIEQNPTRVESYLQLAELLMESQRWKEAERILHRGERACGKHSRLEELLKAIKRQVEEELSSTPQKRTTEALEPISVPWLELGLITGVAALLVQLSPTASETIAAALDVTSWSRGTWLIANLYLLLVLILIKLAPQLIEVWRKP